MMLASDQQRKTALYRYFGHDNELLYVGISYLPFRRAEQHGYINHCNVSRMELEWFDTRKEAEQAEAMAIFRENPIYNKKGEVLNYDAWIFYASVNKWWPFDNRYSDRKEVLAIIKQESETGILSIRANR